ncbi:hypothetical protein ACHQM5_028130 [Ranunculus cassubicifolius]
MCRYHNSQVKMDPFLFSFVLFILSVLLFNFMKPGSKKYSLPPSPSKFPFIGNLHQLVRGSPPQALSSLAQKHGSIMLLQLGSVPTLVVSSASIAKEVMKTQDHVFASRPNLKIPNRLFYGCDIAFSPYSDYWRQVKKFCVLQLLSTKRVQSFKAVREEEVGHMMEKVQESFVSSLEVNLSDMFTSLTNNIVCRVVLGRKYGRESKFKDILRESSYLLGVSNVADFIPCLGWINRLNGLNARVERNFSQLDSFLDEVVREHIEKNTSGSGNVEEDFVDILLRIEKDSNLGLLFTRENTKAIILDMFAAGTDTTSIVLEWAMSELLRHPDIMKEAQKEVRNIGKGKLLLKQEDMEEMYILKSVIKETLRLHPPVPLLVLRESMMNAKLQGYDIPAKTTVMINALAIGRDPMWWKEPESFQPRRFLDGSCASIDFKGQDFQFIPFGAGRRGCPGILFATSIIEIALANLLNKYNWALPNGIDVRELDMQEGSGISTHKKYDLVVVPEKLD